MAAELWSLVVRDPVTKSTLFRAESRSSDGPECVVPMIVRDAEKVFDVVCCDTFEVFAELQETFGGGKGTENGMLHQNLISALLLGFRAYYFEASSGPASVILDS